MLSSSISNITGNVPIYFYRVRGEEETSATIAQKFNVNQKYVTNLGESDSVKPGDIFEIRLN